MPNDQYVSIAAHVPYKTVQRIEKLATEYGLSKANCIMKLLELAIIKHDEAIEVSSVTPNGVRNKKTNIPVSVNNTLRKVL